MKNLVQELNNIPEKIQAPLSNKISLYEEKVKLLGLKIPQHEAFLKTLPKVWCCSLFVADCCIRSPMLIHDLVASDDLFSATRRQQYANYLANFSIDSEKTLMSVLRQFRYREMLRIAWRDLAGWSDLNETLMDLTQLAEVCIQFSLDYLYQQACEQKGIPKTKDGIPINIIVLGMGKLGGWELNFSSDIDLIFAYSEEGELKDRKKTSHAEFFSRLCHQLIKTLDEINADGFVFRTDVRLRPFGNSGPIIMSFAGMENYYLTQAREWERYAMIKARQVAGDFKSGQQLTSMIKPFIYRRYLDYGAFEELRCLKIKMTQELLRKDRLNNIKLGPGGIREIEFIGQAFQLIRGGQDSQLQEPSILKILKLLGEMALLTQEVATQLQASYCFLRTVENHLQQYQDKQVHELPTDPIIQEILAFSLGFSNWQSFKIKLNKVRTQVQGVFEQVFSLSEQDNIKNNAKEVWLWANDNDTRAYLERQGFTHANDTLHLLKEFKNSRTIKQLTTKGAGVFDRLIPQLMTTLPMVDNKNVTLKRVLDLFESVAGRNVYLSLLAENKQALTQLLKLSSASSYICQYLAKYPLLFDELLDTRSLYDPLDKQALSEQLDIYLRNIAVEDAEQLMIKLRQFKHINVLRIAAADIMGVISVMVVSDYLSYIAEAILEQVIISAWRLLTFKHGIPPDTSDTNMRFSILGFGKLGGIELGYNSDLDMVFLYDCADASVLTDGKKPISSAQFYARLGQKVRHILNTKMLSGMLYEVDMRLRPNGDSGLLVTHIDSYESYLKKNAWTWEHQALVRSRFVAGDIVLKAKFKVIRQRVLSLSRNKNELKKAVCEMRDKMRKVSNTTKTELFDLKQHTGGIVDIEFIVQFHVLAYAAENQDLTSYTDNINLLNTLSQQSLIANTDAEILKKAYCAYRNYGHHQVLQGKTMIAKKEFVAIRAQVEKIWYKYMTQTIE